MEWRCDTDFALKKTENPPLFEQADDPSPVILL